MTVTSHKAEVPYPLNPREQKAGTCLGWGGRGFGRPKPSFGGGGVGFGQESVGYPTHPRIPMIYFNQNSKFSIQHRSQLRSSPISQKSEVKDILISPQALILYWTCTGRVLMTIHLPVPTAPPGCHFTASLAPTASQISFTRKYYCRAWAAQSVRHVCVDGNTGGGRRAESTAQGARRDTLADWRVEVDRAQQSQIQQELCERITEFEERERGRKCVVCWDNPKVPNLT